MNRAAAFAAIVRRAEAMLEEARQHTADIEAQSTTCNPLVGTRQDWRDKQAAIEWARQQERWAAERAANALLNAGRS